MLLGLNFEKPKPKYPRSLEFSKGIPVVKSLGFRGTAKEAINCLKAQNAVTNKDLLAELTYGPKREKLPKFEPPWVNMVSKMLCFDGVIKETIEDWGTENERVRYVKVLYFLVDDTIRVNEPHIPNSGLCPGTLLARSQYLKPDGSRNYNWKDLNNGNDLIIFKKIIHLFDCDSFTRQYLTDAGIELNDPEPKPYNPHAQVRDNMAERKERVHFKARNSDPLTRFYQNDGKDLRFYGIWKNDVENPVSVRWIVLKYHLSDDTLEVYEENPPSSGWQPILPAKADANDNYFFNGGRGSFRTIVNRQRVLLDRERVSGRLPCYFQPRDIDDIACIKPKHLKTGEDIQILGKTFYLAKCDEYTSQYYREHFGVDMLQVEVMEKPKPLPPKDYYLTQAKQSERTRHRILPKSQEIVNTVLRFTARMESPREIESIREFIIYFYMEDDTVKIQEKCVKNSGFESGTFLARSRLRKNSDVDSSKTENIAPIYYEVEDFCLGAKIRAKGCVFILKDADKLVFKFMKAHPEVYKGINVEEQKKLADILNGKPSITHAQRMELLEELRNSVLLNYGCAVYPITPTLDLSTDLSPRDILVEKLYSANLPISPEILEKLVDTFTFKGKTDVDEVRSFLLVALGHVSDHSHRKDASNERSL